MRLTFVLIFMAIFSVCSRAQPLNIIPQPVSVKQPKIAAKFIISPSTQIVLQGSNLEHSANFLNDYLQQFYLFKLKVVSRLSSNNSIVLNYKRMDNAVEGAYRMAVNNKGVYIAGDNASGVFYGIQTLIQLLPVPDARLKMRPNTLSIPYIAVQDAPRFAYRGMMLDVARHFFPVSFIKKYIDYLALHKFNKFHWHLTEDQGWRIEIKKYPKLTSVGAWRNGTIIGRYPGKGNDNQRYGGFYTQEDVKEIVKYAAARYIDVIPEIEMPGHAGAAIAAYPELSCFPNEPTITYYSKDCAWAGDTAGKQVVQSWGVYDDVFVPSENTFKFLEDVLDEVMVLFPYNYIHIGGDECPKTNWKRSEFCQQLIKEKGLKDEHGLQSYFIQRMEKYINSKGKKIIGWDEILEGGLAPNAAVMSWRGEEGGIAAAKEKHEVIMTPTTYVYFDYSQTQNEDSVTIGGFIDLEKVYNYEPIPKELSANESKYISGAQANLWTEYIKYPAKVEYMIFPRMAALSEVIWSPKSTGSGGEKKKWGSFEKRLPTQFKRYDLWNANYSKAYFDLKATIIPTNNFNGVLWKVESKLNTPITINFNGSDSIWNYSKPQLINKNTVASAYFNVSGKSMEVTQKFSFSKSTGKKISLTNQPAKNYPGNGAFTLVDGVQNEKGLAKSKEFLGFEGTDCEAVIDLGKEEEISIIRVYTFEQSGSWIYPPSTVHYYTSDNGIDFTKITDGSYSDIASGEKVRKLDVYFEKRKTRYVKVEIKNLGIIPDSKPGAGHKAWLFVDEIEVN